MLSLNIIPASRMIRHHANPLTRAAVGLLLVALATATLSGCSAGKPKKPRTASWDPRVALGWKEAPPPEPKIPARLVTTWTETTLNAPGQTPKRGFGGRLLFFDQESTEPVPVEGQLVVYAFDETSRPSHETQPTRRFIFPAEQFARHQSSSSLGASYSVWLPWDEAGGPLRKISLIARFEPVGGAIIVGEQTRHLLPGAAPTIQVAEPGRTDDVRLASYADRDAERSTLDEQDAGDDSGRRMSTATIPLPSRLTPSEDACSGGF